jgi:hypothetical protein
MISSSRSVRFFDDLRAMPFAAPHLGSESRCKIFYENRKLSYLTMQSMSTNRRSDNCVPFAQSSDLAKATIAERRRRFGEEADIMVS